MIRLLKILILYFLLVGPLLSYTNYFEEGLSLFKEKKYNQAKFKFEQDIVFNPKNEISYLYLSKIFKNLNKKKFTRAKFENSYFTKS